MQTFSLVTEAEDTLNVGPCTQIGFELQNKQTKSR